MYEREGRTDGHRMTAKAALDASSSSIARKKTDELRRSTLAQVKLV